MTNVKEMTMEQLNAKCKEVWEKQTKMLEKLKVQVVNILDDVTGQVKIQNVSVRVKKDWRSKETELTMDVKLEGEVYSDSFTLNYCDDRLSINHGASGTYTADDKAQVARAIIVAKVWQFEKELCEKFKTTNIKGVVELEVLFYKFDNQRDKLKQDAYSAEKQAKKEAFLKKVHKGAEVRVMQKNTNTLIRRYVIINVTEKSVIVAEYGKTCNSDEKVNYFVENRRFSHDRFISKIKEDWNGNYEVKLEEV